MFNQTIKKGFYIEVQSSENDGDMTMTISHSGLSEEQVNVMVKLFPLFNSSGLRNVREFGNTVEESDFCHDIFLETVQNVLKDLDKKVVDDFLGCDIMFTDLNDCTTEDYDLLYEQICSFVKENILGYSDFYFFRCTDKIEVYYLKEDVIIPSVEKQLTISHNDKVVYNSEFKC